MTECNPLKPWPIVCHRSWPSGNRFIMFNDSVRILRRGNVCSHVCYSVFNHLYLTLLLKGGVGGIVIIMEHGAQPWEHARSTVNGKSPICITCFILFQATNQYVMDEPKKVFPVVVKWCHNPLFSARDRLKQRVVISQWKSVWKSDCYHKLLVRCTYQL